MTEDKTKKEKNVKSTEKEIQKPIKIKKPKTKIPSVPKINHITECLNAT